MLKSFSWRRGMLWGIGVVVIGVVLFFITSLTVDYPCHNHAQNTFGCRVYNGYSAGVSMYTDIFRRVVAPRCVGGQGPDDCIAPDMGIMLLSLFGLGFLIGGWRRRSSASPKPTIFSAGGVVMNGQGDVIVVNQRHRSWSLPKGHIDPGEDAVTAAKREIMEETGVTALEYVRDLGHFGRYVNQRDEHGHQQYKDIRIFLFRTSEQALRPQDPENPEARWVPVGDVAKLLSFPEDQAFFRSIESQLLRL